MSEPTTSLRDAIESAIEEPEKDEVQASTETHVESSEPAQVSADPATDDSQDLTALAEGESDNESVHQQARDEQGKFAKQEGMTPGPKSGPKQQADRAPASWKPEVREHWAQLPEGVRAEVARRESEVARTLQETAEARKTAEAVMKTIAPYEAFIKAENSSPLQAIDNLMSTAARLRTGTAPELAQMMAGLVKQFGVGRFGNQFIEALDSALAGQQPAYAPQGMPGAPDQTALVQQAVQQQLAPVQQFMTQFQQFQANQQAQLQQQTASEVDQFLGQAEFGRDVADEMADLLEAAHRKGQSMSLQQAYDKACYLNDSVRKVMQQRQVSQAAQGKTQAAQRAKAAAVSVSGAAPVGALNQPSTDVRSAIEAAISMSSR